MRSNDRKLLFEDVGLVTMRPSDVPTYVEAGAADIGITGKDVLAEQSEREVYELLDLRLRPLRDGRRDRRRARTPRRRRCAGSASCGSRRSTRRSRAATSRRTGRQVEIVEVKGSVELAPLTGLAEGIVDLTATGTTLRENGLVDREEIFVSTARLIANPVAHKLKAAEIDDVVGRVRDWSSRVRVERLQVDGDPGADRRGRAGHGAAAGSVADEVAGIIAAVRAGGDAALTSSDPVRPRRRRARGRRPAGATRGARRRSTRRCARARGRDRQRRASPRRAWGRTARSSLPQGQTVTLREVPVRRAAVYAPGGRNPYPSTVVMGVVTARAAGVEEVYVVAPPPAIPVILAAAALCGADEVYADGRRAGGRRARVRHRIDPAGRRDRRPGQPVGAGGQAAGVGRRRHRRLRRAERPAVVLDGGRRSRPGRARPAGPGRARRASLAGRQRRRRRARRARRPGTRSPRRARPSTRAPSCSRTRRALQRRSRVAEALAPEHLQLVGRGREALAPRVRTPAACSWGPRAAPRSATTSPVRTTRLPTGGAARFASGLTARHFRRRMSEVRVGAAAAALAAAGAPIAAAEGFPVHAAVDGAADRQHAGSAR